MGRTPATAMTYEPSHKRAMIKLGKDNLDISKMHTGEVLGVVLKRHGKVLISLLVGLILGFALGVSA